MASPYQRRLSVIRALGASCRSAYVAAAFCATGSANSQSQSPPRTAIEVVTNDILKKTASSSGSVTRLGVTVLGDAPPLTFHPSGLPCSLNGGAGDTGTQVPTADGKCWVASYLVDLDVRQFGAKCNGIADDATAINAADAAASAARNGRVQFPAASCRTNSPILIPDNVTWQGRGPIQTSLLIGFQSVDAVTGANAVQIRDMAFAPAAGITRTANAFVRFTGSGDQIESFTMKGYVIGLSLTGPAAHKQVTAAIVTNGKFFLPSIGAPSATIAIDLQNFSSPTISSITISGYADSNAPATSIRVRNGDTLFLDKVNATLHGSFALTPDSGENAYAVRISNAVFDSAGIGTGRTGVDACIMTGAGGVYDTQMSNVWCSLSTGVGLNIAPGYGGTVRGLEIANLEAVGNASSGASTSNTGVKITSSLGGTVKHVNITGGCAAANVNHSNPDAAWAIWLGGSVSHIGIFNFIGSDCDERGANSNGFKMETTVDYVRLNGDDFSGNAGLNFSNTSSGNHLHPPNLTDGILQ